MARTVFGVMAAVCVGVLAGSDTFFAVAVSKVPVTASFRCSGGTPDYSLNPAESCLNGDRLGGDALGPYVGVPTGPKTNPQNTYITSEGQFWFSQQPEHTPRRSVFFDFSDVVSVTAPLRRFTRAWSVSFGPNWLASPIGVTNGFWGMPLDVPMEGKLKADFQTANDPYRWTVRFNKADYPASTNLFITCTRRDSTRCTAWTMEASPSHVAQLIASTMGPGKYVTYDEGTFRMPFALDITYP